MSSALIATQDEIITLNPQEILPAIVQPRLPQTEDQLLPLIASVGEQGVLQPVTVYWEQRTEQHRLLFGERRWRSALGAGLQAIPVRVVEKPTFVQSIRARVDENENRESLTPMEMAWALQTYYLLRNLQALAQKHDSLYFLNGVEEQAEQVASSVTYGDEVDQQSTRQQEVINFLQDRLADALATIDRTLETWRPLVSWDTCTREMGVDYITPRRRRQILELLNLADTIQADVAQSSMSENAGRGLAQYPGEVQEQIVQTAKHEQGGLDKLTRAAVEEMAAEMDYGVEDENNSHKAARQNGTVLTSSTLDEDQPMLPLNGLESAAAAASNARKAGDKGFDTVDTLLREAEALILENSHQWNVQTRGLMADWIEILADAANLKVDITRPEPEYSDEPTLVAEAV
jgi:hypothetical protein